ncbi:UDP pyrophosphate synthase [Candidatus Riesia sp. GBBU]|nr:UDP pyrophosphate synthase [Candidatus Riesia sp. GBBU]
MKSTSCIKNIPKHVAIIMDGNRRWAIENNKLKVKGYKKGILAIQKAIQFSIENNIKSLTLYALSKENLNRPKKEINFLLELLSWTLKNKTQKLQLHDIRLNVIGDINGFEKKLKNKIQNAINLTKENKKLNLNIAINYGGRWDIVHGIKSIIKHIENGSYLIEDINERTVGKFFTLYNQPEVDLVIRTGREYRISNFLLWQIAYSELYFTNTLWPDFNESSFRKAIMSFSKRERRFGNTKI